MIVMCLHGCDLIAALFLTARPPGATSKPTKWRQIIQ
jgi:hypothetical protein